MEEKRCPKCKDTKSVDKFNLNRTARDGRSHHCKACIHVANKKHYRENREKLLAASKQWAKDNPERYKASRKKWADENAEKVKKCCARWREENPERTAELHLLSEFGITLAEYNEMFVAQKGKCALCGSAMVKRKTRYPVDHDHSKNGRESVRGIVHDRCNHLLSYFDKDIGLLNKVESYLRKHNQEKLFKIPEKARKRWRKRK